MIYIKLDVKWKWIQPRESSGSEDFKTGIPFKNWPNNRLREGPELIIVELRAYHGGHLGEGSGIEFPLSIQAPSSTDLLNGLSAPVLMRIW